MANEIDSLSISIEAKAQKANSSIDKLVSRLDVLSNSLGKLQNGSNNIVALGRGVESLSRGMQGFKGVGEAKFIRLANGINQLANINTQGLNNAASSLSHMTRAFNNIGAVSQNAVQVADLAKNLGKLGNKSVTNAITNIPKLATAMNNLMTTLSKAPNVSENVIRMTNALANLSAQGSKVGSASNSISKGLNRASRSATRASFSFRSLASLFGTFYANAFLVIRGINGIKKAIDSTADYLEAYNYFNVALGKVGKDWAEQWTSYAEEIGVSSAEEYADSFATRLKERLKSLSGLEINIDDEGGGLLTETGLQNLGLNIQEVTQYASQLASVTNSVGQVGEVSLATASSLTKLGADLSSLFNLDYSDVMANLQSGLIGQSRALYKYGIDITNATLQTYAYDLALNKSVSEMTQMEKMQLRLLAILDQSKVSWGDLANTINSPSNMMRQFSNNAKELGMILGQLFIPALQKVMPVVNGATIAIKRLLVSLANLLGIKLDLESFGQGFTDLEEDTDGLADSLDGVSKSAKKAYMGLRGFDKLNVIKTPDDANKSNGSGASGETIDLTEEILKATEEYEKHWQEALDKMQNNAQQFADTIDRIFKPITDPFKDMINNIKLGGWTQAGIYAGDTVSAIFDEATKALENVDWDGIGNSIGLFLKGIEWTNIFKSVGNFIETLWDSAWELFKGTFKIDPMGTLISSLLVGYFATHGVKIVPKIAIVGVTWEIFSNIGNEIGKLLFPEDATFYENFTWFGDDGFFDTVFGDINSIGDAIKRMGQSWTAVNNAIMESQFLSVLQFISNPMNWTIRMSIHTLQNSDIEQVKKDLSQMWEDIIFIWNNFQNTLFEDYTEPFIDGLIELFKELGEVIEGVWGNIKSIFESEPNFAISGLNVGGGFGGNIKGFATGGFPNEYSLFMAGEHGHAEMLGTVGGKTAVAGGAEITGIREEIRNTANEEIALLRQQNALLQGILEKEFGISTDAVGRATQSWARDYSKRTGRPAFN